MMKIKLKWSYRDELGLHSLSNFVSSVPKVPEYLWLSRIISMADPKFLGRQSLTLIRPKAIR